MKTRLTFSGIFLLVSGAEALVCLVYPFLISGGSSFTSTGYLLNISLFSGGILLLGFIACSRLLEMDWKNPDRFDGFLKRVARRLWLFWLLFIVDILLGITGLALVYAFPAVFGPHQALVHVLRPVLLWLLLSWLEFGLTLALVGRAALWDIGLVIWHDLRRLWSALRPGPGEGKTLMVLLPIALLGTLLRLVYIGRSIRYDESRTFFYLITKPLVTLFITYDAPNNHIFHTFLAHLSYDWFGQTLPALRFPALLAGILLIPAAYLAARSYFHDPRTALFTAVLTAASSALIDYSVNARGYTLFCLLTLLVFSLAIYLKKRRSPLGWFLFVLFSVLGAYTIPTMLYPLAIIYVWLFLSALVGETRPAYAKTFIFYLAAAGLASALFTFLLYVPVILHAGPQALFANSTVSGRPWAVFLPTYPHFFDQAWALWNRDLPLILSGLILIGFFAGFILQRSLSTARVSFALVAIILSPLMVLAQRLTPFGRVWLFLLPFYLMFACAGLLALLDRFAGRWLNSRQWVYLAAALLVCAGLGWQVYRSGGVASSLETGALVDAPQIADYLKTFSGSEYKIISAGVTQNILGYYFRQNGLVKPQGNDWKNLIVVVNTGMHQTFASVVQENDLAPGLVGQGEIIRTFDSALVVKASLISTSP
jgi:hypothetical protein